VIGRKGLKNVADLKGKRIGVESSAVGAYMLARLLETAELKHGDVEEVYLELDRHEAAFVSGRVDALITFEPLRSRLLEHGGTELFSSAQIPGEIVDVLVVRPELFEQAPRGVRRIVEGWFRALEYLRRRPGRAGRAMVIRQKVDAAGLTEALATLRFPEREEVCRLLTGDAPGLEETLLKLARVMQENGLLKEYVLSDPLCGDAVKELLCRP
jgi:NitT/TauT family transport system substrate-binding protein